ncbi:hypothetical protein [Archangium violaceum]|uniref:Uncharacterized protein n=1 Tax=Archangium violaceum Cb vi76 TaxID=1406225 RepID=A0A084SEW0_9BACT|nr:hypothetical protein [Archangium violaceum]KFA86995.1 hypothetical protein Q664_50745 [Archangium violaceum Cb vi76]
MSPRFSFKPTVNVDVNGETVWTITDTNTNAWSWSCAQEGAPIVELRPQPGGLSCAIRGLRPGEATVTATRSDGYPLTQAIGVGLMFVYAPDGKLYAVSTASFVEVDQTRMSGQPIPTLEEMSEQEAYYVPPGTEGAAAINVTCYVINLGYVQQTDVWTPPPASPKKDA